MDVSLTSPGSYVLAVSGGVDSMALLHALHRKNLSDGERPWKLLVAHLDHGMRPDSAEDRRLVQETARRMGLPFVYDEAGLGAGAGEAAARTARYDFLHGVRRAAGARAIVTAHHRDDVLETAVINLVRGSGRKGLTALGSRPDLERPLLRVPKSYVIAYAKDQGLAWREDSTNQDTDYLRNYVRHRLLPRLDEASRERLWEIIDGMRETNREIDVLLEGQLRAQPGGRLDRGWFISLPHDVALETMAAWLRASGLGDFDSKALERLVVAAKTAAPGKTFDVFNGAVIRVNPQDLALTGAER
jgi:tRNA(Ile)-lysidine synthetase-like protein